MNILEQIKLIDMSWYQSSKGISDAVFFKWQLECKGSV